MRQIFPGALLVAMCLFADCSRSASRPPQTDALLTPTAADLSAGGSCQTIADASGLMLLKQNLSGGDSYCLRIVSGSGELDCQGHDVQAIQLSDVHDLTIRNCRMQGLLESHSNNVTLIDNLFVADTRKTVGTVIRMLNGANNRIAQNTIDGSWQGQLHPAGGFPPGADDGILIENDANLSIERNVIRNVWDCGVERIGNQTDPVSIRSNQIANAGECGVGGWFAAGWRDSLIADNTVSNSGSFALIYYSAAQNQGVDHITFRNNVFENNQFLTPLNGSAPSVNIDFTTAVSKLPIDIGNNVFRGNDFGNNVSAPRLAPSSGFVDGGANVCRQDGKSTLSCVR